MDLSYSGEELAFRDEVRGWLAANLPADLHDKVGDHEHLSKEDLLRWHRILAKKGWVAPAWPKEWGGTGWNVVQRYIFEEECGYAGTPPLVPFGLAMCAPVLHKFGTEAQKKRHLPPIYNGDLFWCQGYSEPGSGSDLASLKTKAVRDGDHYVVNGQKIWTTLGHYADWIFALVRTNPHARKPQEGISFLLIDMKTPGITVRPIISIDGSHHFNEVFFDNVRVPVTQRVYEENKGWDVAKFLLGNERTGIARLGKSLARLEDVRDLSPRLRNHGAPLLDDKLQRERVASLEVRAKALEITQLRVVAKMMQKSDGKPDPFSSLLKIKGSELNQDTSELIMDAVGPLAMPDWARELDRLNREDGDNEPPIGPDYAAYAAPPYLMHRASTIAGGTTEIQKNILNKAILRL